MRSQQFKNRIRIERRTQARELGHPVDAWEPVPPAWADIRSPSGLGTIVSGNQAVSRAQYSIRIRQRRDIDATMRVLDAHGTIYDITSVLHGTDEGGSYTDLICVTGANDGD